uniref:Putative DNA binding, helix-turn-helix domain containing protein n=1 Tax=viral metagenome TaxID=1070528 RepID=A0A6M3KDT8_9ZZZZ
MNCLTESEYESVFTSAVLKAASRTKRNYLLCHIPIDKTNDLAYSAAVTLKVFDDDRPTDEKATSERVLLIRAWENKLKTSFATTYEFLNKLTSVAGGKSWLSDDARKLRRVRRKNKWSQGRLAKELGVSQQLVSSIEKGERESPPKVVKWMETR